MSKARDLGEKFLVSPVKEVAYEIRFPPYLRIPYEIYKFQEKIRDQLPTVLKSAEFALASSGMVNPQMDMKWAFEDTVENLRVSVDINALAVVSRKHRSFDDFFPKIKQMTDLFCASYGIDSFSRVGLRYVNEIPLGERPADLFNTLFVPSWNTTRIRPENILGAEFVARQARGTAFLTLRNAFRAQPPLTSYIIDIDAYAEGAPIPKDRLYNIVNDLHNAAITEFHENVTDALIDRLRKGIL